MLSFNIRAAEYALLQIDKHAPDALEFPPALPHDFMEELRTNGNDIAKYYGK